MTMVHRKREQERLPLQHYLCVQLGVCSFRGQRLARWREPLTARARPSDCNRLHRTDIDEHRGSHLSVRVATVCTTIATVKFVVRSVRRHGHNVSNGEAREGH